MPLLQPLVCLGKKSRPAAFLLCTSRSPHMNKTRIKRTNTCSENQGKCQRMRSGIAVLVVSRRKEDHVLQSLTPAATSWLEGSVESVTRQARLRSASRVGVCVCVRGTLVGSADSMFRQRRIPVPKR
jgi:hypothetical protein